jgi:pyruvate/2-oxoglutarate dehydrogenase complex dihydrolipoamide dehydrogenase (E3) component
METDVIVVGLGPGGEDAAGRLAEAGLEVVGIEARLVGGECPYWGCVPSKMMIRAADKLAEARRIPVDVTPDWAPVARRIRDEATDSWDDKVAAGRLTSKGVTLLRGYGRLTGPREITVGDKVVSARRGIVFNTGTEPNIPPIDGLAGTSFWTNREAIEAEKVPESLIVLGGGAIGVELAQVFARFGSKVTIIENGPCLLANDEPEASKLINAVFAREGITVRSGVSASQIVSNDSDSWKVQLNDGSTVTGTRLLVATGRRTNLAKLGVAELGLDESAHYLPVDDRCRVKDGVWAIGDVTGKGAFTHVSMYQAAIVVRDILGQEGPPADYRALPRVSFTDPEVGSVGMTEKRARAEGLDVRIGYTDLAKSARGWIHGAEGFIKLVASDGILVGATSAGPMGGEVLSALVVAVHARVTIAQLRSMIYAYPTFHRAIEAALPQ